MEEYGWLCDEEVKKLLNYDCRLILDRLGVKVLGRLMETFGGCNVWVRQGGEDKASDEGRLLLKVLSRHEIAVLRGLFPRGNFYVQILKDVGKPRRDRLICKEFDGGNYRRLAVKFRLSENQVRIILKDETRELKARPAEGQMSFEEVI